MSKEAENFHDKWAEDNPLGSMFDAMEAYLRYRAEKEKDLIPTLSTAAAYENRDSLHVEAYRKGYSQGSYDSLNRLI